MSKDTHTRPTQREKPSNPLGMNPREEEIVKFLIGLKLLGQERQKRYLQYMAKLTHETERRAEHDV